MTTLKNVFLFLVITYLIALIFVYVNQNRFIYYPVVEGIHNITAKFSSVTILGSSIPQDVKLDSTGTAIVINPQRGPATSIAVVFHGNAGLASDRLYYVKHLVGRGARVYLAEYAGYGWRAGAPSEKTLVNDGIKLLNSIRAENKKFLPVTIIGESLGSGVAVQVSAETRPDRLALITPFLSLKDVAEHSMPFFPTGNLLRDTYRSDLFISRFTGETAVVIAQRDEVIGAETGEAFVDLTEPTRTRVFRLPYAGHNDWMDHISEPLWDFIAFR